ncbi:MAG TPA: peptidoglycan bridge formation glycyltransferase FemA/FemB family protein, partial [Candidatus Saccharibacteria bacterium]|nr:peptidoglycan bridge formation glycyltransferase FemA/FemB family protein [Candidatus Saccharibacteria bacterium]
MNKPITRGEWGRYVLRRPEANFLQAPEWGTLHETLGSTVVRDVVLQDDKVVGGWQGIIKNARRGRYLEVPGGPLLDWSRPKIARQAVLQMQKVAKEHKCVFIRIRPQIVDNDKNQAALYKLGFKKAPMHLHAEHTSMLDLTKTEEELLAGMRQQTRYEVKRAAKQDITVSWQSGEAAVDEFYKIQKVTARRQKFVPSSLAFLRAEAQAFGEHIRIYRAEKDG